MIDHWELLATIDLPNGRRLAAPWLLACEGFKAATHLKIKVDGRWRMTRDPPVIEPDGLTLALAVEELILADLPAGALLGKFGGSSAAWGFKPPPKPEPAVGALGTAGLGAGGAEKADGPGDVAPSPGRAFAIGGFAIVPVPDKVVGPLYVAPNLKRRPLQIVKLKVTVWGGVST